jgi:hypothetical protein
MICDPLFQEWEWKADVNATYRYMGLRRDPALTDPIGVVANIAAALVPALVEDFGELIGAGIEIIEATWSERSFREYMSRLDSKGLVKAVGEKRRRIYEICGD